MVYAINNRIIHRGFHSSIGGRQKITKPDGKTVTGNWIAGNLTTIPMPTPPGAAPQMPVLCLDDCEKRGQTISERSVCACTISLFSGTWTETEWDNLTKPAQQAWLKRGKSSGDWKGLPVFEGDVFFHKAGKRFFVATYDILHGFRLVQADDMDSTMNWYFGLLTHKGTLWAPPKDFPMDNLAKFHKMRNTEARVEAVTF